MDLRHGQWQVQREALDPHVAVGQPALEAVVAHHGEQVGLQHPEPAHAGDALEDDARARRSGCGQLLGDVHVGDRAYDPRGVDLGAQGLPGLLGDGVARVPGESTRMSAWKRSATSGTSNTVPTASLSTPRRVASCASRCKPSP